MSEVMLGRDPQGRRVAVKHVPAGAEEASHRSRLRREARTTARVDHPTAVAILEVVDDADGVWLVMEYVDGITLAAEIAAGRLPAARALDIAAQIADGLAAAHDAGILHRDLKSENVMLTPDGRVRVLDYGLAKALWSGDESQALTHHGEVMGTCRAMSPEQARGWTLDGRSDLFSLGSLLYEMVTGVSPFRGKTPVATMNRVCSHEPPPAHLVAPEVPRAVSQLIAKLHKKKASERPQDARQAAALIAETQDALEARSRRRWPAATLPVAALLTLLLASGWLLQRLERRGEVARGGVGDPASLESPPGDGLPGRSPTDALEDAVRRAPDAQALEAVRRSALAMLARHDLRLPSAAWDRDPPPPFLATTAEILAAIDHELAAPDAAVRWLDLAREIDLAHGAALSATNPPAAGPASDAAEPARGERRQQVLDWASPHIPPSPLPPLAPCRPDADDGCPPPARLAAELAAAVTASDADRLADVARQAAEAGFSRLELRAGLERIRLLRSRAGFPSATVTADADADPDADAARLADLAQQRGLHSLLAELRPPEGSP